MLKRTNVTIEKLMDENAVLRMKRKRLVDALKQHIEDRKELIAACRGD